MFKYLRLKGDFFIIIMIVIKLFGIYMVVKDVSYISFYLVMVGIKKVVILEDNLV